MRHADGTIYLPADCNYIGGFLTFACQLHCPYCLNQVGKQRRPVRELSGREWAAALNRLSSRPDLPVTLQGGEPTAHPDFYELLEHLKPALALDLLTNLQFSVDEFMRRVPAKRFQRTAPYASIRVSYHPEQMDLSRLLHDVLLLQTAGYSIGIWGIMHPGGAEQILTAQRAAQAVKIDFRVKEFLGEFAGRWHGTYRYPDALGADTCCDCECRTTEILVAPDGRIYRCHRDLHAGELETGSLLDPGLAISTRFRPCHHFGQCHPCDIKVKHNRFQEYGHSAVEIRGVLPAADKTPR